jgi:hypothetical protein
MVEAHVKRARREALRKRSELEAAEDAGDGARAHALRVEFEALERALNSARTEATRTPARAEASFMAENRLATRVRKRGCMDVLLSLDEVVKRELATVPDTQSQLDQLKYRAHLLRRLERVEGATLFNLVPVASFRRVFVSFVKEAVALWVPSGSGTKRKIAPGTTVADLLPLIFKPKAVEVVSGGRWAPGSSFSSDGVQVHFRRVNSAHLEAKRRKAASGAATRTELFEIGGGKETSDRIRYLGKHFKTATFAKRLDSEKLALQEELRALEETSARLKDELRIRKDDAKKATVRPVALDTAKRKKKKPEAMEERFHIPKDATLVGLDTGIRNLFGCAREDEPERAWACSTAWYRHQVGELRRRKNLEDATKTERRRNSDFATASDAVGASRTKTGRVEGLIEALRVRGRAFEDLYDFYGAERHARHRFQNYIGAQRTLARLVVKVARKPTDVIVVGDADFGSTVQGLPPGVAGKFVKKLRSMLGPKRVVFGDEFRSSCLDSERHHRMFHPPKELSINKKGQRYVRYLYGIYQSVSPGYSRPWNRDCNAAINIYKNFRHLSTFGNLPEMFRRTTTLGPSVADSYSRYRWNDKKKKFIRWPTPLIAPNAEPTGG